MCIRDRAGTKYASAVLGDSTAPCFEHDFEVDMGIVKVINSSGDWRLGFRKGYKYKANMNDTSAPSAENDFSFAGGYSTNDTVFPKGYFNNSFGTSYVSYGFRRGQGFDVQIYAGDGSNGQAKPHSLGVVPEIIAYRRWSSTEDWTIYNSRATNASPIQESIQFNTNDGEFGFDTSGNGTPPTATHFYAGYHDRVGASNHTYVALLWASVTGVSKIDQYTGTAATHNVSLGFAPKFIWIKRTDTSSNWIVMSEAQGWSSSGNDTIGEFNNSNQFASNKNPVNPTATGFDVVGTDGDWNASGGTYLYYAHA